MLGMQFTTYVDPLKVNRQMKYAITCRSASNTGADLSFLADGITTLTTVASGNGAGSITPLKFHNVSCDPGQALNSFRLVNGASNTIQYSYKCIEVPDMSRCAASSTALTTYTMSQLAS